MLKNRAYCFCGSAAESLTGPHRALLSIDAIVLGGNRMNTQNNQNQNQNQNQNRTQNNVPERENRSSRQSSKQNKQSCK